MAVPEQDAKPVISEPEFAYGTITAQRPSSQQLQRKRFRIALFGDFSGRAARGQVETGPALAARPPIVLDPDTLEEVIKRFACELVLPLGAEGAGQEAILVKLSEFDDLHPDELFENVALFSELVSLRKQLQSGVTVDHASRSLADWAKRFGTPVRVPRRASGGQAVPADRRLSAFQQLIGDQGNSLREASAIDALLARIVGPHIRALPNPDVAAMQQAVDAALSDAMRLVLHHPEFQSVEAQWRSLDLIARSVEVDDTLEVVLYDVSAEELAADLATADDLSQSGLTRLLTEGPLDPETGRGGYSALIGLYGFEETPPHAELLGRIARVAAHVDAPFFTSLSPGFLTMAKQDRAPLVARAWDTLQQMPEAGHLGLVSPRFLLRRPYGAKSDPLDSFAFEEFTQSEGLRGMLWGNPVVLVTILLARSFKENGAAMQLGSIMSLGGMPYHTVTDRFGDQVALPCTERNIDLDKIAMANDRGVMALSAVKGRDELRLTSFFSVAGSEILGPWSGVPAPAPSPADPREKTGPAAQEPQPDSASETGPEPAPAPTDAAADPGLDDLGLDDLDLEGTASTAASVGGDSDLDDLDALLAGFDAESGAAGDGDTADSGEMDAELAALLADL
ncbi:type VI secretion system contractile sheath large subunit [Pseudophaeobacter sp. MA21411-1]|nr:type VI secretion system contractile sheath large subunit [Pseudophaeobacter flagellatus]MCD9149651.1 type VI secretion system contractile sheath large subunit [Pseudophaeobacter flagellatus]